MSRRPGPQRLTAVKRAVVDDYELTLRKPEEPQQANLKCFDNPYPYIDTPVIPTEEEAMALCAGCPVLERCDAYATATNQKWGVWGGKFRGERKVKAVDQEAA